MMSLPVDWSRVRTILCLGAHCDDIEIGCGGALQLLRARNPELRIHWVVWSGDLEREAETRAAAKVLLTETGLSRVEVQRFPASYFPHHWAAVKDAFETLKAAVSPDLVLTHRLRDMHQDHRVIAELTWNTFRDHLILEYEIPKYEGDLGQPNVYTPLTMEFAHRKVQALMQSFPSQHSRHWFQAEVFLGLMRLRGVECNSPSGYAEAFHARKLVL